MTVSASLDPADSTRIMLDTAFHHRDLAKSLPGSTWSSADRSWKLPRAWTSCLALRATFGDELVLSDDLVAWASDELENRIKPAMALREVTNLDDDNVPKTAIVAQARALQDEIGLYPHQAAGAAFMATALQDLVTDETGTGKTAQTITAMRILHRMGHTVFPALVIAPNTVKKTWERELDLWWPGLTVSMVSGGAGARRKALETPAHVYIMNWDLLAKHSRLEKFGNHKMVRCTECGGLDERVTVIQCEVHVRELNHLHFNTVVADEIHRAKSPTSKWTRALWAVADQATYRFGLTGTPVQDNLTDLWALLRFVSPDEYGSKTKFIDRFAETGYNMWGAFMVFGVRRDAESEFYGGVYPRMRRMLKKIVLPFLPPIVRQTRYVEMLPVQRKAYVQMVKKSIAELDGGTLVGLNPLTINARLMQFSSSYAELIEKELPDGRVDSHVKLIAPSNKINALISDIKAGDYGDSSLVIFAQSRQLIDLLSIEMEKQKIEHCLITGAVSTDDRQKNIDAFQSGKIKYILVTIDAGGVGLTLTAADTMVFLQRHWSSTAMKQAESRAHRIGSEKHKVVTIVDYVSEDTVEEKQIMRLGDKYGRIESIVRDGDLLRKLLADEEIDVSSVEEYAGGDDPESTFDE